MTKIVYQTKIQFYVKQLTNIYDCNGNEKRTIRLKSHNCIHLLEENSIYYSKTTKYLL